MPRPCEEAVEAKPQTRIDFLSKIQNFLFATRSAGSCLKFAQFKKQMIVVAREIWISGWIVLFLPIDRTRFSKLSIVADQSVGQKPSSFLRPLRHSDPPSYVPHSDVRRPLTRQIGKEFAARCRTVSREYRNISNSSNATCQAIRSRLANPIVFGYDWIGKTIQKTVQLSVATRTSRNDPSPAHRPTRSL